MATTTDKKYTFVIECESQEILDCFIGGMLDGAGENVISDIFKYEEFDVSEHIIRDGDKITGIKITFNGYYPHHPLYVEPEADE